MMVQGYPQDKTESENQWDDGRSMITLQHEMHIVIGMLGIHMDSSTTMNKHGFLEGMVLVTLAFQHTERYGKAPGPILGS